MRENQIPFQGVRRLIREYIEQRLGRAWRRREEVADAFRTQNTPSENVSAPSVFPLSEVRLLAQSSLPAVQARCMVVG